MKLYLMFATILIYQPTLPMAEWFERDEEVRDRANHKAKMLGAINHIIETKADPNLPIAGENMLPLRWTASSDEHTNLSGKLLALGANPNLKLNGSSLKETPLKAAIRGGSINTLKLFLETATSINILELSSTALHILCTKYSSLPEGKIIYMAQLLLDHGALANIPNSKGKTTLQKARRRISGTKLLQLIEEYSEAKKIG